MGLLFGSGARHDHPAACARTVHGAAEGFGRAAALRRAPHPPRPDHRRQRAAGLALAGGPTPGTRPPTPGADQGGGGGGGLVWGGGPTPGTRQQTAGSRRQALKTPHALRGMFHCNSACNSCFLTLPVAVIGSALTKRICGTL